MSFENKHTEKCGTLVSDNHCKFVGPEVFPAVTMKKGTKWKQDTAKGTSTQCGMLLFVHEWSFTHQVTLLLVPMLKPCMYNTFLRFLHNIIYGSTTQEAQ
jgi:hypothetical protein